MNTILIVILTIILIIAIVITFYILQFKKIEYYKIRVNEAEKLIIEELNRRFDLIMQTEKEIKKKIKKELDFYHELEKVKKSTITSYDLDLEINQAVNTIYKIEEDYPKILENKEIKNVLRDIRESDNKIVAAKSFYNTNANKLNDLIKKIPYNIIAKLNKIKIAHLYEASEMFDELKED